MAKVCFRIGKCPLSDRITVGRPNDPDVVHEVCPKCKRLFFHSEVRKARVKKNVLLLLLMPIIILSLSQLYLQFEDTEEPSQITIASTPESTILLFFEALNENDYQRAFNHTNNTRWASYDAFKNALKYWKLHEVYEVSGKSYYSTYQPDTIINMKYLGVIDEAGARQEHNYDFLLKEYDGQWRIIRILYPKNPDVNVLTKDEIPITATDAVKRFLQYLDKGFYEKAYILTDNPKWGRKSKFISSDKGWGCITNIDIYEIREREHVSNAFKIVYAKYYAKDPCNKSSIHEFNFQVKKRDGLWKITKALNH